MKHKYLILKNDKKNKLTIQEFAELEKQDEYTLLCEETYNAGHCQHRQFQRARRL